MTKYKFMHSYNVYGSGGQSNNIISGPSFMINGLDEVFLWLLELPKKCEFFRLFC
jgi:hypothetical protein